MKRILFLFCFVTSTAFAQHSLLDFVDSNENEAFQDSSNQTRSNNNQFCEGNLLLDQPPNQSNGLFIDTDCDFCLPGTGVQIVSDNFVLPSDTSLGQFVIFVGYFPDNNAIVDTWTLTIHNDNGGIPGTVVYTESNVSATKTDTGVDLFGVDEFRVVLTTSNAVPLTAGTYWLEIHNDSIGSTDSVFWEVGDTGTNSIAGNVFATEYPAVTWNAETNDMALQICQEAFDLNVNVTGLAATNAVTVSNAKDLLDISNNGITKLSGLSDGTAYNISITQQPDTPNQVCTITSGNASGNMISSGVTVDIACVTTQYNVDVSVSGLAATNSVSFSNGGDTLSIGTDGTQTISTADDGSAYDVDITAQPDTPDQVCSFDNADAGNLAGGDATVNVSCVTTQYTVGVNVSGLAGGNTVVFQNNGGDDLNVNANGVSTFATALDDGSAYNVSVLTQPTSPNQTCVVTGPMGNLAGGNVELAVACTTNQYDVNISVTGLAATNSVSFSNGGDTLSIAADGTQTITTADDGSAFDVDITAQPDTPDQVCSFDNADAGNLAGGDATVNVSCVTTQYTVGVNVSGLAGGNSVVFQNNGGDDLNVNANGVSTFATALDDGSAYNVSVLTQPTSPNQTCVVTGPMGNLAGGNVELAVACTTNQYDVNISVTGLAATNSVSFSNGGDTLSINTDGTQTITTADDGTAFDVDITAQPDTPDQVCSFDNADAGNLAGGDATVNVSCVTTQYTVGVNVSG
ncbi:beta strand repeat-containing protein, partial [Marinicella rhabdoformis]|uniref:beta strand repeat-containing protein n=1 Tax=Marinicella rhabdoformis TaxID=2580566 RepID=UPI0012AEB7C9